MRICSNVVAGFEVQNTGTHRHTSYGDIDRFVQFCLCFFLRVFF